MHEGDVMVPGTLALLRDLMGDPDLAEFRLVGGTGLAIQYGHRKSVDLDLFESGDPRDPVFFRTLTERFAPRHVVTESRVIRIYSLRGVKVDFVSIPYPWLDPPVETDGIRLASPRDIAAMKLLAIVNRGSKKDFVDLHALLSRYSMEEMFGFFFQKYGRDSEFALYKSVLFFGDADPEPMPEMAKPVSWETIKVDILSEAGRLIDAREGAPELQS